LFLSARLLVKHKINRLVNPEQMTAAKQIMHDVVYNKEVFIFHLARDSGRFAYYFLK